MFFTSQRCLPHIASGQAEPGQLGCRQQAALSSEGALGGALNAAAQRMLVPLEGIAPGPAARAVGACPVAAGLDLQVTPFPIFAEQPSDAALLGRVAGGIVVDDGAALVDATWHSDGV